MYFNQVVYGTSKYDRPIISNRLVGPIMLINPYRLWNKIATSSKFALSENAFTSVRMYLMLCSISQRLIGFLVMLLEKLFLS